MLELQTIQHSNYQTHKGLYTEAELDALQLEMFFPFKRQAQQNHQARVLFSDGSSQGSYLNLLSPADMTSLSKTIGGKISWFFRIFGKWAATIIGVVVVLKIIVWFVETLINCCTLKKSGKKNHELLGAFMTSVTHLLTLGTMKKKVKKQAILLKDYETAADMVIKQRALAGSAPEWDEATPRAKIRFVREGGKSYPIIDEA